MRTLASLIFACALTFLFIACKEQPKRLPILGNVEVVDGDTLYHVVPDITLVDQDSQTFKLSNHPGQLILADFFFTSCPSICPKVQKQMLRLYDRYKADDRIILLSHTIDQRHDSIPVLHRYAKNLEVDTDKWKFLTASRDSVYFLADKYFVSVVEDPSAPMGYDHSGRIILLDKTRHVRGYCEGTDANSVTAFFLTIDELLAEEYPAP